MAVASMWPSSDEPLADLHAHLQTSIATAVEVRLVRAALWGKPHPILLGALPPSPTTLRQLRVVQPPVVSKCFAEKTVSHILHPTSRLLFIRTASKEGLPRKTRQNLDTKKSVGEGAMAGFR